MDPKRLEAIYSKIIEFNTKRGWLPLPQDVAKSICIESAELLEHFQWDGGKIPPAEDKLSGKDLTEIKYEVADVLWYLIIFCHVTGIDFAEALELKHAHNQKKYPEDMFAGKQNPSLYYSQKQKYRVMKKR